jgi:Flp pilus assembly protein TadB
VILVVGVALVSVAGVGLLAWAVVPPRPPLAAELDRLLHPAPLSPPRRGLDGLAEALWAWADPAGGRFPAVMADLAVMERSPASLVRQTITAGTFALTALVCAATLRLGGVGLPLPAMAWLAALAGAAGAVAPWPSLRADATKRRAQLRDVLSAICDLVAVRVAAGEDLEAALGEAVEVGGGWAFATLRRAVAAASATGEDAWVALSALGQRLDVDELVTLGQHMELAGTEGARIREALGAQAKALREEAAAEVKAKAGSVTERMSFPLVLLLAGFVLVIGYPALSKL